MHQVNQRAKNGPYLVIQMAYDLVLNWYTSVLEHERVVVILYGYMSRYTVWPDLKM